MAWPASPADAPLSWLSPVAYFGWVGVQIFFVLSGFIISASARNSDAWTFAKKRAIRVLPALWLAVPLAFVLRAWWGEPVDELLGYAIRSALLSPQGPYIDGVVWTLVVEAVFYALIAVMLVVPSRFGSFDRRLFATAIALGAVSSATILTNALSLRGEGDPGIFQWFGFTVLLMRHGAYFALGMLLYQAVEGHRSFVRLSAIGLFTAACWLELMTSTRVHGVDLWPAAIWTAAILFAYVSVVYGDKLTRAPGWALSKPIGKLTYPLYLNHFIVAQAILPMWAQVIDNSFVLFAVMLANLLGLAYFITEGPEAALQSWAKSRWLGRRKSASAQVVLDPGVAQHRSA